MNPTIRANSDVYICFYNLFLYFFYIDCTVYYFSTSNSEIRVRIAGSRYYGAIEAKLYDFWGPVCKLNWDNHDANVTCNQLNFAGGVAFYGSTSLDTPIAVGRFNCTGQEDKLDDCPYKKMGEIGCTDVTSKDGPYRVYGFNQHAAGVLCYNASKHQLQIIDCQSTFYSEVSRCN